MSGVVIGVTLLVLAAVFFIGGLFGRSNWTAAGGLYLSLFCAFALLSACAPEAKPPQAVKAVKVAPVAKTGLWLEPASICKALPSHPLPEVTLYWDVTASGTNSVIAYVMNPADKEPSEHNFGIGDAVGSKKTGAWAVPGLEFKLRDADTQKELGKVTLADGSCE